MNTTTSTDISIDTSTALIEYSNSILYVRIKEGIDLDVEQVKEQYAARDKLVGTDAFSVLVDARMLHNSTRESRDFIANNPHPNLKAMAFLTRHLAIRLLANFFMNFNKPTIPTKLFNTEEEGIEWLQQEMKK